jgi:hypothetical protein
MNAMAMNDFSERELNLSSWWVRHKKLMRQLLIGLLVMISAVSWIGSLIGWVKFGLEWPTYRNLLRSLSDAPIPISAIRQQRLPKAVTVESSAFVVAGGTQRYDFVATVRNPNGRWLVQEMSVAFQVGSEEVPVERTFFILPESTAVVTHFNVQVASGATLTGFAPIIKDVKWKRVDAKTTWRDVRLEVDDVQHGLRTQEQNEKPMVPKTYVSATIVNQSPYDFWNVDVPILLYDTGGTLIAANFQKMAEFKSFEKRMLAVQFPTVVPNIARVEILPTVNIFDLDNYIVPQEHGGQLP